MTVRLLTVKPETPLKEVATILVRNRIGGVPQLFQLAVQTTNKEIQADAIESLKQVTRWSYNDRF
jgi:CBS domain-containing protein